jgi:hypothetical protein
VEKVGDNVNRERVGGPAGSLVAMEMMNTTEAPTIRRQGQILCLGGTCELRDEYTLRRNIDSAAPQIIRERLRID